MLVIKYQDGSSRIIRPTESFYAQVWKDTAEKIRALAEIGGVPYMAELFHKKLVRGHHKMLWPENAPKRILSEKCSDIAPTATVAGTKKTLRNKWKHSQFTIHS